MQKLLYFIIAILATTIGSSTGMGGGVIIKPVLDVLGDFDVETIGMLSSITVFAMSLVSVGKQLRNQAKVDGKVAIPLALGSVAGGIIGNKILDAALSNQDMSKVKVIQNMVLAALLIVIFFYMLNKDRLPKLGLTGYPISIVTGVVLGIFSSFLGIGGGPINVAAFIFLFAYDTKTSAVYSLITILFSQISKLGTVMFTKGFGGYNFSILPFMIIGGILGGFIGAEINKRLPEKRVDFLFNAAQIAIFGICIFNIYQGMAA